MCVSSFLSPSCSGSVELSKADRSLLGNTITYGRWALSEGSVSIVSVCLPNITHLAQRARHHGILSLFTRREYASIPRLGPGSSSIPNKGNFRRIGNGGTTSGTRDRLMLDQGDMYSVSASAEQQSERDIALGQVHMRQDVNVRGDERWAPV